jgi:riboflavin biosynthesis pyrimidine reductase
MKSVLLTGGGKLNSSFLRNNLVDEILLNINPVLLGKGIKIFSEDQFEKNLKLVAVKKLSSSIVQLHYKLQR